MNIVDYSALPHVSKIILDINDNNEALIMLNNNIVHKQIFITRYYSLSEDKHFQYRNVDESLEFICELKQKILNEHKTFLFKYSDKLHKALYIHS